MLKLEKSNRTKEINIRIRERETFFNRSFLQALFMAIIFHIGAFWLFRIHPFKADSSFIFPPVHVHHSIQKNSEVLVWNLPADKLVDFSNLWLQSPSLPTIENLTLTNLSSHDLDPLAFHTLERMAFSLPTFELPLARSYSPLKVFISGDLAKRELIQDPELFLPSKQTTSDHLHSYRAKYKVQVDSPSGTIFWYDKILSTQQASLDLWLENLLFHIRFVPDHQLTHINGEIDFFITLDETRDAEDWSHD